MFPPMQGAYEKEGKEMENLKIVNPDSVRKAHRRRRTCKLTPLLQLRTAPLMEICVISGLHLARTKFAPIKGAYETEAKEIESLEMLSLGRCEERTYENGPASYPTCSNYAHRRKWKFAEIRRCT